MVEQDLKQKYEKYLDGLDIYENKNSLRLSKIIIKPEYRNEGIGSKIMNDLIEYADKNKQIIVLTPSSDFGGNKNKLIQFYKKFDFKHNKGYHKNFEFMDAMIRYPKLNENFKPIIKKLLKESLMTKEKPSIDMVNDFVKFAKEFLGINEKVKIILVFERTPDLRTTAYYDNNGTIKIYSKDRAIVDICRSISHELVHYKQNMDNRITNPELDGADGSEIENEANAVAGVIIRKYGRLHPEIYS